jgi:membrane-associated phospholipid phosphatase
MVASPWEWNVLEWFYTAGSPFWDVVFTLISKIGSSILIIFIIVLLYFFINKEKGEKFAFILFGNMCFNNIIKSFVKALRPFEFEGEEHLRVVPKYDNASGTSFPSGHSQNSAAALSLIALENKKNPYAILLCILSLLLIMISRLYLGVHFPHDVIMGAILGIAFAFAGSLLMIKLYHKKWWVYILFLICFTPFLFLKNAGNDLFRGYGMYTGFILGIFIENKWVNFNTIHINKYQILTRILVLLLCIAPIFIGFSLLLKLIQTTFLYNLFTLFMYMLISTVAFGIVPLLFKKIEHKFHIDQQ